MADPTKLKSYPSYAKKPEYQARWREQNREKLREDARKRRASLKVQVLAHYGTCCAYCGFDNPLALVIDHVADNGAEERKALGGQNFSGWRFYDHLKKLGWPEGYQTLCANCNMIKQAEKLKTLAGMSLGDSEP